MKRFLLTFAVLLASTGAASADYVLIKININQMNFFPGGVPGQPGGMMGGGPGVPGGAMMGGGAGVGMVGGGAGIPGGMMGGGAGVPGGAMGFMGGAGVYGAMGGAGGPPPMVPEDPNAKWVSAFVELKNVNPKPSVTPFGPLFYYDHKWGKNNWLPFSPALTMLDIKHIRSEPFSKEFEPAFAKAKNDKKKTADALIALARMALTRAQMKEFHRAMTEAEALDPKHLNVKQYSRVKKELARPFKDDDPAQADLLAELRGAGFKPYDSVQKHFRIYAQINPNDPYTGASVTRRLATMEETLEAFYYWFAIQEKSQQPNLPKHRLNALLTGSKEEFTTRHLQWGQVPMAADGFTPRRDNIVVMSSKPRLQDANYQEFETLLSVKLQEANVKLQPYRINITREDLLSGKIVDNKAARQAAVYIAAAQSCIVVAKALEEEAERHTVTNETTRQLLIASEMFPRNVQIPDWMVEGLAAFFEVPAGGLYPTIGAPSWTHLISFRHFLKTKRFSEDKLTLKNVVTDFYFQDARQMTKEVQDSRGNEDLVRASRESWELARCSSWAFVYYLAQTRKLDLLFNYGKELDQLPRDMDLNDLVLEATFAKAFNLSSERDPRQIADDKLGYVAGPWIEFMRGVNMENGTLQVFFEQERAKLDVRPTDTKTTTPPNGGGPNPMPPPPMGGMPPMPMGGMPPMPMGGMPPMGGQPGNLGGTTWSGSETLAGFGKLTFRFGAGGQVTMFDTAGQMPGQWKQNGNNITLDFGGGVIYTGTVNGKTMQGNANNGAKNWTWTVSQGGAGNPPAGMNPNNPNGGGFRPPPGGFRPPPMIPRPRPR